MSRLRVVSFALLTFLLLAFTACGEKSMQNSDGFTQIMEDNGFEVQDITATTDIDALVTQALAAEGENYQIEFYILNDNDTAESVFNVNQAIFNEKESTKFKSVSVNYGDYNYYAFTGSESFYAIARIDNTMLYCVADKDYRDEIIEKFEALGYK